MTLCAAACAGIYPILHLGRPYFAYWLFPYPNSMTLWPQWKSRCCGTSWRCSPTSLLRCLFWYLGLMPDLATMRDRAKTRLGQVAYGFFAMGFRGSGTQWRHLKATYGVLAAIMAPLVVSVHSVVGLDFAGGATPGWHSTEYPPFFVFGALWSGLATVMLLVLGLRRALRLSTLMTERHIQVLAKLLLTSSLLMSYAYVMDAFEPFYSGEDTLRIQFLNRITGDYAGVYWGMIFCNCLFPLVLCFRRRPGEPLVACSGACGLYRRDVAGAFQYRSDKPDADPLAFGVGPYVPHDLGLDDVRRHGRAVLNHAPADAARRTDGVDV